LTVRRRDVWLGLALALTSWLAWAAWPTAQLVLGDASSQYFDGYLAVLDDPTEALDLAAVRRADEAGHFKTQQDGGFSFGFSPGAVWLRFVVTNPAVETRQRWLVLENPFLASVILHLVDGTGRGTVLINGAVVPVEQRPLVAQKILFPLTIPAGKTQIGYLRVSGPTMKMSPMALWQPLAYVEHESRRLIIKALVIATAVTAVVLFSLLAWRSSGRLVMLAAGVGDALFGFAGFLFDGVAAGWLPASEALWQNRLLGIVLMLGLFFHILFARAFLELRTTAPGLAKGMATLAALCLLVVAMQGVSLHLKLLTLIAVPMLAIAMGVLVTVAAWRGIRNARLYILAWGGLFATIVIRSVAGLAATPTSIQNNDFFLVGFLVGTLVLSYAMYRDVEAMNKGAESARKRLRDFQRTEQDRLAAIVESRTRELRDAKARAEEASQARLAFLSTVSHELRTPLHTIVGYAQLLKKGGRREADVKLAVIERSGLLLVRLIDEVLEFIRGDTRSLVLRPEATSLVQLASQIDPTGQLLAAAGGNCFVIDLAADLPPVVNVDPHRLTQVLTNLIGNACKYTSNGTVSLRIERLAAGADDAHRLRFTVEDTGVGIAAEHLTKIFEPFSRVPASDHQPGMGLGLAISRQIVRVMGGDIGLESQPGCGSRFFFTLTLPAVAADVDRVVARLPHIVGHVGPQRTMLVVDDIVENRLFLHDLCRQWGFRVLMAGDGAEALAICRRADPVVACALVDQFMPVMDGWGFLRAVRASPDLTSLPVVLISAAQPERPEGFPGEVNFDHVILKPMRQQNLAEFLQGHLGLEWILMPPAGLDEHGGQAEVESQRGFPSANDLAVFREMLILGRIVAIRRWAEELAVAQPDLGGFAAEVVILAQAVDLAGLKRLLEHTEQCALAD
jgi:two-component system, sensor histidine kinase LadS